MSTISNSTITTNATESKGTQVTIRPLATLRETVVSYGDNGEFTLRKDQSIGADELAALAVDDANHAASASLRAVNTLRFARTLPPIGVGDAAKAAYDHVLEKLENGCKTRSTFLNIVGLIECVDIIHANALPVSAFTVKESLGYLRKKGALDEKSGKLDAGDEVTKALLGGIGTNAVREVVSKEKAKRRDLFPVGGKKKGTATAEPKPEAKDLVAIICREFKALAGLMDTAHNTVGINEARGGYREAFLEVATLAGFDCKPIAKGKGK